ncbi:MAG TPA: Ig-like domain-containing protein, partial [Chthoniobacterales bacterium]|nr:Ig-like domain-containing protein [Chthoniobacterales bacterium]
RADKLAPVVSIKAKATTKENSILLNGVATDASGIDSVRVFVNGHKVPAKLGKRWTAKVTTAEVKKWTKAKAKTISVTVLAKDAYGNAAATTRVVKL